jgi:hypothetical protein
MQRATPALLPVRESRLLTFPRALRGPAFLAGVHELG